MPRWLSTVKLGDYAASHPPMGRIYLPCASYDEMLEWSLPAEKSWEYTHLHHLMADENRADILRYMYSGYWRNFMVKYPEINRMHKKMLLVHEKVHKARKVNADVCGMDSLWRAQCNCPYWHGVFGGIYLTDIRAVTYSNLIEAEKCADRVLSGRKNGYEYRLQDFDGDGRQEVIVESPEFNFYLSPHEGGSIFEWDCREAAYNLLSSVSRKREGYHRDILEARNSEPSAGNGVEKHTRCSESKEAVYRDACLRYIAALQPAGPLSGWQCHTGRLREK